MAHCVCIWYLQQHMNGLALAAELCRQCQNTQPRYAGTGIIAVSEYVDLILTVHWQVLLIRQFYKLQFQ